MCPTYCRLCGEATEMMKLNPEKAQYFGFPLIRVATAVNSSQAGNCNFCAVLLRVEPHMHAHAHEHTHAGLLTPGKEEEEEERITVGNAMCPWHTQDSENLCVRWDI